MIGNIQK